MYEITSKDIARNEFWCNCGALRAAPFTADLVGAFAAQRAVLWPTGFIAL